MADTLSIMDDFSHYIEVAKAMQRYDVRGEIHNSPIAIFHWGIEIKH